MISVVLNWLAQHPNVRTITAERIERWGRNKHYEPASLLDIEKCLESNFKKMHCWKVDGVLMDDTLSESYVHPCVGWVENRFGTRVHVDDCEWVTVYRRQ